MVSANDLPFSEITRKRKENQILHLSCCFYRKLHLNFQFYANTHLPGQFHTLISHFTQLMTLAACFYQVVSHFDTVMISGQPLLCSGQPFLHSEGRWLLFRII